MTALSFVAETRRPLIGEELAAGHILDGGHDERSAQSTKTDQEIDAPLPAARRPPRCRVRIS
jgi:hypothetical protein